MLPDEVLVRELTELVWATVLGLEARESAAGDEPTDFVTSVRIEGAWRGSVTIHLSWDLARKAAATMLACNKHKASPADVADAVGELANMIAGNLKSILPGPSKLSLPLVRVGRVAPASGLCTPTKNRCWFECAGQEFTVTVTNDIEQEGR